MLSSSKLAIYSAKSIIPSPPFANPSDSIAIELFSRQIFFIRSISSFLSSGKRLIATTDLKPYLDTILIALIRFSDPFVIASLLLSDRFLTSIPPCHFKPLTVATIIAQKGFGPPCLTLISMNFSKPKSAPKPASVITYSEKVEAI